MTILVTGGAGFIGSNFIVEWLSLSDELVINLDKLTHVGKLDNLRGFKNHPKHQFIQGDILNQALISDIIQAHQPRAIIHFAAESHVDRSIHSPADFVQTNILGTQHLLSASLAHAKDPHFRFLHVSTDEVYGSLKLDDKPSTEQDPYRPNSPYSASKAASDHLVRAYYHTYGLPVLTSHCSNNYGPCQYPEKLIPLLILNALSGKALPVYGKGINIRDWLHVSDHCSALRLILEKGTPGETYNIGGNNEKTNIEVVHTICDQLDLISPRADKKSYRGQIQFVTDRLGHDLRYAIDSTKIQHELGWKPLYDFESGLAETLHWYIQHAQRYAA
jgi:dTDP-glucose 4,6-dehydratase